VSLSPTHLCVIPSEAAFQAERGISRAAKLPSVPARFLAPPVKARGFGMTQQKRRFSVRKKAFEASAYCGFSFRFLSSS
jgi:hypothetical protein